MKATVVTDGPEAGRFAGTVAQRGTFILNGGDPWSAPESPTGYRDAMQGDTPTRDGVIVRTANLSADLNHVSERATFSEAVDAMAHTGAQLARVRYVDVPGYGTVAIGAAWPGLSDLQVRKMQASALSGDWRWREEYGQYDFTGAIFVNNPGLPLPARPLFAPSYAMAASLALPHPPVVGDWQPDLIPLLSDTPIQEALVTITNTDQNTGAGGIHVHVHNPPVAASAQTAAPPVAPVPPLSAEDATPAPDAPTGDVESRLAELEQRMAAVESWLADDAMSEVDMMGAALPEPVTAAPAFTVVPTGDKFCVTNDAGDTLDCFDTAAEAQAQIDAVTTATPA